MLALVIIPILVALCAQLLKLIFDGIPNNVGWQPMITNYGGMPSSHTAYVASLITVVALSDGINSSAFAVAIVLAAVVIRDAVGFRQEIGKNAVVTNALAQQIFGAKAELLTEQVGHTIPQVIVGALVGICLGIIFYGLWFWL